MDKVNDKFVEQTKAEFEKFKQYSMVYEIAVAMQTAKALSVGDIVNSFYIDIDEDDDGNETRKKTYHPLSEWSSYHNDEDEDGPLEKYMTKKYDNVRVRYLVVSIDEETGLPGIVPILPNGKHAMPIAAFSNIDWDDIDVGTLMHFEVDRDYADAVLLNHSYDAVEAYKLDIEASERLLDNLIKATKSDAIIFNTNEIDAAKLSTVLLKEAELDYKKNGKTRGHVFLYYLEAEDGIKHTPDFWIDAGRYNDSFRIEYTVSKTGKINFKKSLEDVLSNFDMWVDDEHETAFWVKEPQDLREALRNGQGI